jgi:hypothetical protein
MPVVEPMHEGTGWGAAIAQPLAPPCAAPPPASTPEPGFAFTLLQRHGRRPLGFEGRLLVAAELAEPGLPLTSRIALHETAEGGLVAAIRHAMRPPLAEESRHYAEAAPADALLGFLHAHDPLRDLPADWLLQVAENSHDLAKAEADRLAAAAALALRLRTAWRGLVAACFGLPAQAAHDDTAGDHR